MKLINNAIIYIQNSITLCVTVLLLTGCIDEEKFNCTFTEYGNISLFIQTASASINEDKILWEDRVDELRMIVFEKNGDVIFNEKLYFPNGFNNKSKAVQLRPGIYDFYFIANETVYPDGFVSALLNISNLADFQTDIRFTNLFYNPDFIPTENTPEGRFLMSAIYEDISIIAGGTEQNPLLLSLPTEKVELIRSLAKIDIVFRKKTPGSNLSEETINTVIINNTASILSVPPYNNYYEGAKTSSRQADLSNLDFTRDSIGTITFYIPEFLVPVNSNDYTVLSINNTEFPIQTDNEKIGIQNQRRKINGELSDNSVIRNYHYTVNAYVHGNNSNEIEIRVYVEPWKKDKLTYIFGGGEHIVLPPITPTDSSVIMPTLCDEQIEILYKNENMSLQEYYKYSIDWGYQTTSKGDAPYYCESKYGSGWRIANSCELMSYLAALDVAYNVWFSYTWEADSYNNRYPNSPIPLYPMVIRKAAQDFLEKLTGIDLSGSTQVDEKTNPWSRDNLTNKNLGLISDYFSPGDILYKPSEFEDWWKRDDSGEDWYECENSFQVPAFWWASDNNIAYISLADRKNWDIVLYTHFRRMDSPTNFRCVRTVNNR